MGLQDFWGPLLAWICSWEEQGCRIRSERGVRLVRRIVPSAVEVGIFAGPVLVAVGTLLLLLELGQPLRFWRVLLRPTSSMMSVGALLISLFLILGFVHMALLLFSKLNERTERGAGHGDRSTGVWIMLYTGLLLGLLKAVPFWNTPALPLLFVLSHSRRVWRSCSHWHTSCGSFAQAAECRTSSRACAGCVAGCDRSGVRATGDVVHAVVPDGGWARDGGGFRRVCIWR